MKQALLALLIIVSALAGASYLASEFYGNEIREKEAELNAQLKVIAATSQFLEMELNMKDNALAAGEVVRAESEERRIEAQTALARKILEWDQEMRRRQDLEARLADELAKVPVRTDDELEMSIEDALTSLNPEKEAAYFIGFTTDRPTAVMINDAALEALFSRPLIDSSNLALANLKGQLTDKDAVIDTQEVDIESLGIDKTALQAALDAALTSKAAEERGRTLAQEEISLLKRKMGFDLFRPGLTFNIVSVSAVDPVSQKPTIGFLTVGLGWKF